VKMSDIRRIWPALRVALGLTTPRAERATAQRKPCAACGRVVAHTMGGRPYVHRCRVELLQGKQGGE
jgi:hypothetical protein